mmetsp:Transcript_81991/g.220188  ORF Transcript_81991/g.220188 Transcript_81991/m.220188 type:complete len:99 (-) Transcript_81991:29-325(-)
MPVHFNSTFIFVVDQAERSTMLALGNDAWRKLLIGHVVESELPAEEIVKLSDIVTHTRQRHSLDCLRSVCTDGSIKTRRAEVCSNGIVFKIPCLLKDK